MVWQRLARWDRPKKLSLDVVSDDIRANDLTAIGARDGRKAGSDGDLLLRCWQAVGVSPVQEGGPPAL